MKHIFYVISLELESCGYDCICQSLTNLSNEIKKCTNVAKRDRLKGTINIHFYDKDKYSFAKNSFHNDENNMTLFFDRFFDADKNILKSIPFDYSL